MGAAGYATCNGDTSHGHIASVGCVEFPDIRIRTDAQKYTKHCRFSTTYRHDDGLVDNSHQKLKQTPGNERVCLLPHEVTWRMFSRVTSRVGRYTKLLSSLGCRTIRLTGSTITAAPTIAGHSCMKRVITSVPYLRRATRRRFSRVYYGRDIKTAKQSRTTAAPIATTEMPRC